MLAQGLFIGTAQAEPMSVHVAGDQLYVQAGAGQVNRLTVSPDISVLVVTDIVPVDAGTGCAQVTATEVACPARGLLTIHVSLGDQADTMSYDGGLRTVVYGGTGGDRLIGGTGTDYLHGGDGDDRLYGGAGPDVYWGDAGADTLDDTVADQGANKFDGGVGDDVIDGSGQAMRDGVIYSTRTSSVHVDLTAGTGGEAGENDVLVNIQDIYGGSGDDTLTGNGLNNTIKGNGGYDVIDGAGGLDYCVGEVATAC